MYNDSAKAIDYVRYHIEKEIRVFRIEEKEYSERGSNPEDAEKNACGRWVRERKELENSTEEVSDAEVAIAMTARAIALNFLLQDHAIAEYRPEWSPEIAFFKAFIDTEEIYDRMQKELYPEEDR